MQGNPTFLLFCFFNLLTTAVKKINGKIKSLIKKMLKYENDLIKQINLND